jgi:hypothetical protein
VELDTLSSGFLFEVAHEDKGNVLNMETMSNPLLKKLKDDLQSEENHLISLESKYKVILPSLQGENMSESDMKNTFYQFGRDSDGKMEKWFSFKELIDEIDHTSNRIEMLKEQIRNIIW